MALLELELPRNSQPQEAVPRDADHPLERGLAVLVYPYANASVSAFDGRPGASAGSTRIATREFADGRALAWNTALSSQYIDTPTPTAPRGYNAREFTLYARFRLLEETAGGAPTNFATALPIFGVDITGAGTSGLAIGASSSTNTIAAGLNLGANRYTGNITLTAGVTYDAFLRCTTGANATLTVIGVAATASTAAVGVVNMTIAPTAAAKAVTGCRTSTSAPGSAACFVGALWWRNLSDAEIVQVAANPWDLLEPDSIPIHIASAGATFNPAWAIGSNAIIGAAGAHA